MKILHLLAGGHIGGIENLCKNIVLESKNKNVICFLFDEGKLYEELINNNIEVLSLKEKNIKEKVKILTEYCINNNINAIILHHEGIKCNYIFYKLHKKTKGKLKFIRYMHSCYDNYYKSNNSNCLIKVINKIALQKVIDISDLIVFISKSVKKTFEDNFKFDNKKTIVIYNGIPKRFFNNDKSERKDRNFNIAYIGRLEKEKGVNVLIDSIECLVKNNKINLQIVGNGTERTNLENQVKELKITNLVKFIGNVDNVIPILDKSLIFVYPSLCEEGLGISVIEAMARGCIPITFRKGGLPELIDDEKNGLIVKEANKDSLANAINKIIKMPENKIKEMQINAIKKASQFKIEDTIINLEKSIEKIL